MEAHYPSGVTYAPGGHPHQHGYEAVSPTKTEFRHSLILSTDQYVRVQLYSSSENFYYHNMKSKH